MHTSVFVPLQRRQILSGLGGMQSLGAGVEGAINRSLWWHQIRIRYHLVPFPSRGLGKLEAPSHVFDSEPIADNTT